MAGNAGNNPPAGQGDSSASSVGQAIGFITEFNQNAAIFNEVLAPLLDLAFYGISLNSASIQRLETKTHDMNLRLLFLEASSRSSNADNDAFKDCTHTAGPC